MEDIKIGYFSLKLRIKDAVFLNSVVKSFELDGRAVGAYDMHMTLMFDSSNPLPTSAASVLSDNESTYTATISGVDLFGGDSIVLILEAPEVVSRHKELSIFMRHSFEEFTPHVSVVYDATESDFYKVKDFLTGLIGTSIVLYGESFATIKE